MPLSVFAATWRHLAALVEEAERRRPALVVEPDLAGEVVSAIAELADVVAPRWRSAVRWASHSHVAPNEAVTLVFDDYQPLLAERLLELLSTADRLSETAALPIPASLPDVRAFRRQLHTALEGFVAATPS